MHLASGGPDPGQELTRAEGENHAGLGLSPACYPGAAGMEQGTGPARGDGGCRGSPPGNVSAGRCSQLRGPRHGTCGLALDGLLVRGLGGEALSWLKTLTGCRGECGLTAPSLTGRGLRSRGPGSVQTDLVVPEQQGVQQPGSARQGPRQGGRQ